MNKNISLGTNAILNIIKQFMAILFPVITVSYASRVLGQEQFGAINYVRSVVSYFSLFAALGVSTYAIREGAYIRNDSEKYSNFANQVFTINILSTCLAWVALILFMFIPRSSFGQYRSLALVFSISFLLQTIGADWVNSTFEDFKYITIRYCVFNLISILLLFAFVRTHNDGIFYALILVMASAGGNLLNIFYIRKYTHLKVVFCKEIFQHLRSILLLFSIEVATSIYINSDTTMLGMMVSNSAVAIYTVASNIYIAVKRVSNAAVTVALPRLSYLLGNSNKNEYKRTVNNIINIVITLILPCIVGTFALSPNLMIAMGGSDYGKGATSLKILAISLIFAVLAFLLSRCVLLPYKKDKIYMIATIISAILNVGLNIFLIPIYAFNGAAVTTLISEAIVCGIMFAQSISFVRISVNLKDITKTLIACLPIGIICFICNRFMTNNITIIFVSFIASVLAFGAVLLVLKHSLGIKIISFIWLKIRRR